MSGGVTQMVEKTTFSIEEMEETFYNDPVYEKINSMGLTSTLLETLSRFESMELSKTYSTKEAATFLHAKEHRLINTLNRELLFPYFQVKRKGSANRYVYDWQAIWRFKMVFILMDEGGLKLVDIEDLLHSFGVIKKESESVIGNSTNSLKEGQKVEVIIVSETLDSLKQEIAMVKRSFQEEIEEIKNSIVEKESATVASVKEVLIQEHKHQCDFLEKLESQLKKGFTVSKGRRHLFSWGRWRKEDSAEKMVENLFTEMKNNKSFIKEKIKSLENKQNDSLLYINRHQLLQKQRAEIRETAKQPN